PCSFGPGVNVRWPSAVNVGGTLNKLTTPWVSPLVIWNVTVWPDSLGGPAETYGAQDSSNGPLSSATSTVGTDDTKLGGSLMGGIQIRIVAGWDQAPLLSFTRYVKLSETQAPPG